MTTVSGQYCTNELTQTAEVQSASLIIILIKVTSVKLIPLKHKFTSMINMKNISIRFFNSSCSFYTVITFYTTIKIIQDINNHQYILHRYHHPFIIYQFKNNVNIFNITHFVRFTSYTSNYFPTTDTLPTADMNPGLPLDDT